MELKPHESRQKRFHDNMRNISDLLRLWSRISKDLGAVWNYIIITKTGVRHNFIRLDEAIRVLTPLLWLQSDLEDQANELRSVEENSKKACADAARLAEELRQEQDHASHIEKMRRTLESQVKELQVCISDSDVLYHLMYER